jgi:hypothetical protein
MIAYQEFLERKTQLPSGGGFAAADSSQFGCRTFYLTFSGIWWRGLFAVAGGLSGRIAGSEKPRWLLCGPKT